MLHCKMHLGLRLRNNTSTLKGVLASHRLFSGSDLDINCLFPFGTQRCCKVDLLCSVILFYYFLSVTTSDRCFKTAFLSVLNTPKRTKHFCVVSFCASVFGFVFVFFISIVLSHLLGVDQAHNTCLEHLDLCFFTLKFCTCSSHWHPKAAVRKVTCCFSSLKIV